MAVITCRCGAKVRVPDDSTGAFRCPKCRELLAAAAGVGAAVTPMSITDNHANSTGATCPICQTPIAVHETSKSCPECGEVHHQECWDEIGGCAIYGCKAAPATEKQPDSEPAMSAWG